MIKLNLASFLDYVQKKINIQNTFYCFTNGKKLKASVKCKFCFAFFDSEQGEETNGSKRLCVFFSLF